MEAAGSSEASLNIYDCARRHVSDHKYGLIVNSVAVDMAR